MSTFVYMYLRKAARFYKGLPIGQCPGGIENYLDSEARLEKSSTGPKQAGPEKRTKKYSLKIKIFIYVYVHEGGVYIPEVGQYLRASTKTNF